MLRVHAEDGDKGVPREIVYGLVSEGNPFTLFFNISESSGKKIYHELRSRYPVAELKQLSQQDLPFPSSHFPFQVCKSYFSY